MISNITVSTQKKSALYKENMADSIYLNLPAFDPKSLDFEVSLHNRPLFLIRSECLSKDLFASIRGRDIEPSNGTQSVTPTETDTTTTTLVDMAWGGVSKEMQTLHQESLISDFTFWKQLRFIKRFIDIGTAFFIFVLLISLVIMLCIFKVYFNTCHRIFLGFCYCSLILVCLFETVEFYLSAKHFYKYQHLNSKNCGDKTLESVLYGLHLNFYYLNFVYGGLFFLFVVLLSFLIAFCKNFEDYKDNEDIENSEPTESKKLNND